MICPTLTKPVVFYLDAHTVEQNPLLEELAAIKHSPCKRHTILIDDVRMFGTPDWHGMQQKDALARLSKINPHYRYRYLDTVNAPADLLVAEVPQ